MRVSLLISLGLQIMVMTAAMAKAEDTISFCMRNCTTASCHSLGVQADCKARCSDEKVWKVVAQKEMTQSGTNLYNTQIAKCLNLQPNDIVDQKVPEPQPLFNPKPVSDKITNPKEDLCAAAMAAAHEELRQNSVNQASIPEQNLTNLMETHQSNEQNS